MFYAFTPEGRDNEGFVTGGQYLGQNQSLARLELLVRHTDNALIVEGPEAGATTRGRSKHPGFPVRLTYTPIRQAFGANIVVREVNPWALFIGGSAIRGFKSQTEALEYLKGAHIQPLLKEDGTPWA